MMARYINSITDIMDIVEDAVDAMQQLRYGNEQEAREKLRKISLKSLELHNHLNGVTVDSEDGGE